MAIPSSMQSIADSVIASHDSSADASTTPDSGQQAVTPEGGQQATTEQPGQGVQGLIGVPAEQAAVEVQKIDGEGAGKQLGAKWQFAEGHSPETVIATDESGQPVTLAEAQSGYLRQSDYTQKTQALKAWEGEIQPLVEFWDTLGEQRGAQVANLGVALVQGNKEGALKAIVEIAQANGLELAPAGQRQRDELGRFVSQQEDEDLDDDDDSIVGQIKREHRTQVSALQQQIKAQEDRLNGFFGTVEQQRQESGWLGEAQSLAQNWEAAGLQGIDPAKAISILKNPSKLTVEQAMYLAYMPEIIKHNAEKLKAHYGGANTPPNELGGAQRTPSIEASGKSLGAFAKEYVQTLQG